MNRVRRLAMGLTRMCLLLVVAGSVLSCDRLTGGGDFDLDEYINQVTSGDGEIEASPEGGDPPEPGTGPSASASATGALILGGTTRVVITSQTPFTKVIVSVRDVEGFYELELDEETTATSLILFLPQQFPNLSFNLRFAVVGQERVGFPRNIGNYAEIPVNIRQVGTGDVQVSLSWDTPSDVDLHVVDPAGEEIYYADRSSASNGVLDLDSNPACRIDRINNENITWPTGLAPRGTYIVRVDYWDSCEASQTNYTVTVHVTGQPPQIFNGTLTGPGDRGGLGSGIEVTRFTF
jgi:hypothetical protein